MLIKQMSVFVENTTGRLAEITKVLAENGINIKACTIAETTDFGILRCIVANPEDASRVLKEKGFTASLTEVIAVSIDDRPGGLSKILDILSGAGVSVEYIYSTVTASDGEAVIMMKTDDAARAIDVLGEQGVKLWHIADL